MKKSLVHLTVLGFLLAAGCVACSDSGSPTTEDIVDTQETSGEVSSPDIVDIATGEDADAGQPPDVPVEPDEVTDPDADVPEIVDIQDVEQIAPDVDVVDVPPECTEDNPCAEPEDPCWVALCEDGVCVEQEKDCRPTEFDPCDEWYCELGTGDCKVCVGCLCPDPDDAYCFEHPEVCDDDNVCTTDICDPDQCDEALGELKHIGCHWEPNTLGCDDGNECTTGDVCGPDPWGNFRAVCRGSDLLDCDDGDGCTFDYCDPDLACRHTTIGTTPPCDEIPCPNGEDLECPNLGSQCAHYYCGPGNICVLEYATGECDDGDPCTHPDQCVQGQCVPGPTVDCDDGDSCTVDSCVRALGCQHAEIDPCPVICETVQDCLDYHGAQANANPCRQWTCTGDVDDPGICVSVELSGLCDDGDPCTVDDRCVGGICEGGAADCNDGSWCTKDFCDPVLGCVNEPRGEDCEQVACVTGQDCRNNSNSPLVDNICYVASCWAAGENSVCFFDLKDNCLCEGLGQDAVCDNGNPCTIDHCVANDPDGVQPDPAYYCAHDPDYTLCCPEPCQNDAACTSGSECRVGFCDIATGSQSGCCLYVAAEAPCGEQCETNDDCDTGDVETESDCLDDNTCGAPYAITCEPFGCRTDQDCRNYGSQFDDDNVCTDPVCVGCTCQHVANEAHCSDTDECTVNEHCSGGECVHDDLVCTEVSDPDCFQPTCDPLIGCTEIYAPVPGECSRQCAEDPSICDDGNPCTDDICLDEGGCENVSRNVDGMPVVCRPQRCEDSSECDDGNPCTFDQCVYAAEGEIIPLEDRVCEYVIYDDCQRPPEYMCDSDADCAPPLACEAEDLRACCADDPLGVRAPGACDPVIGCRWLPGLQCGTGECRVHSQADDCGDGDACTLDLCDPLTLTCSNSLPSWRPAENLLEECVTCADGAPCPEDIASPCVTLECVPLAEIAQSDPAGLGTCFAYIDEEIHPFACDDFDLCTTDVCTETGCEHTPVVDCSLCDMNEDCDDGNACTEDVCSAEDGGCTHTVIDDCTPCQTNADCPGDGCDWGVCELGRCIQPLSLLSQMNGLCVESACQSVVECDDGDPDTLDICFADLGVCAWVPGGGEFSPTCETDEDCLSSLPLPCRNLVGCDAGTCVWEMQDPCEDAYCNGTTVVCEDLAGFSDCMNPVCTMTPYGTGCFAFSVSGLRECCETPSDCTPEGTEFSGPTLLSSCDADGYCRYDPMPEGLVVGGTCETAADCGVDCEEGAPSCEGPQMCFGALGLCLDWPCATAYCSGEHRCVYLRDDCGICEQDIHCLDEDPCTQDTCVDGTCLHTSILNCTVQACDFGSGCDSGDPCVSGLCVPAIGCLWVPNDQCD